MNDFKGMSRSTVRSKIPSEMWDFARNILLTGKYLSVSNEKGNEYGYSIPGVVIGYIVTNEDIVYLSIDGNYSCVGYVNIHNDIYTSILRTINPKFKFNLNCPIEGVYVYNYKKELIVIFSDGINKNSSSPKLLNINNLQVPLTADKEFVNFEDYSMLELFDSIELPSCNFEYEKGSFDAEVVHISMCYVYDDNTDGSFSPILDTAYPNYKGYNTVNRNIKILLTHLSSKFTKIKLAFVIKKNAATFGYTTPILNIINGVVDYTLSTEESLLEVTAEEILIPSERFTKIRTITKTANQVEIGNVQQKDLINFQKYANRLKVDLKMAPIGTEGEKYKTHPSLLPDEVYSIRIIPIYKDGTKAGVYHIPGRLPKDSDIRTYTKSDFSAIGLKFEEFYNKNYKAFHFENSGKIYSNGNCDFGYWENEDLYPNKTYYNSSDIGGQDLRGTPVRYHRIPALDSFEGGTDNYYKKLKPKVTSIIGDAVGYMPKFIISVNNFEEVFPTELKNLLQGYELVIEKRSTSGTYIEANGFLHNIVIPNNFSFNFSIAYDENETQSGTVKPNEIYKNFSTSYFTSVETLKDKININSDIVKVYYTIQHFGFLSREKDIPYETVLPVIANPDERIAAIKDAKYLLGNNIASGNRFGEERLQLQLKHLSTLDNSETFIPIISGNSDLNILYVSLITLNKNIYNLENNSEFISLGVVLLNKPNEDIVNGDVFTTNIIKKSFTGSFIHNGIKVSPRIYSFMNYYMYGLYAPISNQYIINGTTDPKSDYFYGKIFPSNVLFSEVYALVFKDWRTEDINILNSYEYNTVVKGPNVNWFNDYTQALPPALTENYVSYFPYRVYKGLALPNESLQTKNLRFFPTNQYYEMRNDRGEIIALRGYNRGLYIQQKYSLFETTISDSLEVKENQTFLGSSEIFDRIPEEIVYNDNIGYVGSNSQFACFVFKDGYVTIDEESGKIFIINKSINEVSQKNMNTYFVDALPLGNKYLKEDLLGNKVKIDNPFCSIGYIVGFDKRNNRILITKKYYSIKANKLQDVNFDGEFYYDKENNILDYNNKAYFNNESKTFSFALDSETWVCDHDYFPNGYLYTNKGFFTIKNDLKESSKLYIQNSDNVNPGNFYGEQFESYIDLCFNGRLDLSKQYQALYWTSDSIEMNTGKLLQFKTIDAVIFISDFQCSGRIDINPSTLTVARNTEGKWQLNEFRDMTRSTEMKVIDENGNINLDNISTNKVWYDKGMFIGNYIVTRMIWDNKDKVITYINNVNVKSIISKR